MKAQDIMTATVISVPERATVAEATDLMLSHHVSALPVTDAEGKLAGLISEGDLMRRIRDKDAPRRSWWLDLFKGSGESAQDFVKARSHKVSDVMTRDVISVDEDTSVGAIARLLEKHRIKRVPVTRHRAIVGIVSRSNLLHALSAIADGALPEPSQGDRDLRTRIETALNEVPGITVNLVNFTVDNGHVSVWGIVDSEFEENAVRVAVENVSGVIEIDMQLGRLSSWAYGYGV